jgi:hypothetical protein
MVPAPDRQVRRRARRWRAVQLVGWAVLDAALAGWLVAGGPWFSSLAVVLLTVEVAANAVVLVRHRGPEDLALSPGRLRQAVDHHDTVLVPATWSPARRSGERRRQDGQLGWVAGRLTFTVSGPSGGARARPGSPDLQGVVLLDAEPWELRLAPEPTWARPPLVVHHGSTVHVLELAPAWDLTVGVGAMVAAEWWRQLREVGVGLLTEAEGGARGGPTTG